MVFMQANPPRMHVRTCLPQQTQRGVCAYAWVRPGLHAVEVRTYVYVEWQHHKQDISPSISDLRSK